MGQPHGNATRLPRACAENFPWLAAAPGGDRTLYLATPRAGLGNVLQGYVSAVLLAGLAGAHLRICGAKADVLEPHFELRRGAYDCGDAFRQGPRPAGAGVELPCGAYEWYASGAEAPARVLGGAPSLYFHCGRLFDYELAAHPQFREPLDRLGVRESNLDLFEACALRTLVPKPHLARRVCATGGLPSVGLHLRSRRKLWKSDHENWGTCARAAARGKAWYVSAFEDANAEAVAAFAEGPIYKLPKESITRTHVVSALLRRGEDPGGAVQSTEDAFADLLALSRTRSGIVGSWGSTFTWVALTFAGPGVARLSIKVHRDDYQACRRFSLSRTSSRPFSLSYLKSSCRGADAPESYDDTPLGSGSNLTQRLRGGALAEECAARVRNLRRARRWPAVVRCGRRGTARSKI